MTPSAAARLVSRFSDFRSGLNSEELQNWHILLSAMVGEMAERDRPPSSEPRAAVWQTMVRTISEIYPGGALRLGCLEPLRDDLDRLAAEASELIDTQVRFGDKISGTVESGTLATSVAGDPRLRAELVRQAGVPLSPPTSVCYFYYHRPGDYLLPHADPIVSSGVICLTNLVHTPRTDGDPPSALVVHDPRRGPIRHELSPGQSLMMFGGGTVHAREPIGPGETIINLSVGFSYAEAMPESLWNRPSQEDAR
ncbi:MAG: hypothetical protein ACRDTE_14595 [Pseudonocardiaceae bacterium]